MKAVVQRVSRAAVEADGGTAGSIGRGLLVLVGFSGGDGREHMEWMAAKILGLRIFPDADGRMNRDIGEAGGELLIVSQFTL
jgi:D-tyrosyl-tRNA(Tyr) deacylase